MDGLDREQEKFFLATNFRSKKVVRGKSMKYDKPIMSVRELTQMGYPKSFLYQMAHSRFRDKVLLKRKGKFFFFVEELERYRKCITDM